MAEFDTLVAALRQWARDRDSQQVTAAVELLIWHEHWLRRKDFVTRCIRTIGGATVIRWANAREFSDWVTEGGSDAPRASTSEAAILDLAVALGEDRFRLANFGTAHRQAVARAVAAAVGLADPREVS